MTREGRERGRGMTGTAITGERKGGIGGSIGDGGGVGIIEGPAGGIGDGFRLDEIGPGIFSVLLERFLSDGDGLLLRFFFVISPKRFCTRDIHTRVFPSRCRVLDAPPW